MNSNDIHLDSASTNNSNSKTIIYILNLRP